MIQLVAVHVRPGHKTSDGYVVQFVSYETEEPAYMGFDKASIGGDMYCGEATLVTKVWTHESFQRPRSVIWRHRQWDPIDTIPLQSRNESVVVRSNQVEYSASDLQLPRQ